MSGTSLDGVDVAVVNVRGRRIETIGFVSTPYQRRLRDEILSVSDAATTTAAISRLNYRLGELYGRAVLQAIRRFGSVELIGCHGQTIFHEGGRNTLQLGEAAVIAERTGVPVVSNFRARDIAAGGQGAPLVSFLDYLLFRHAKRKRVALNIGGIANITVIPAGATPEQVTAFDTGPGNMVIDTLARDYSRGALSCDRDGRIAASGHVDRTLLKTLLKDSYYRRKPPKNAGREEYGEAFVSRLKESGRALPDVIATATVLTAATIAGAVGQEPCDLIVSGGGTRNPQIMAHLAGFLPHATISTTTDHGIDADAKEAIAFAVLAYQTWIGRPSNVPGATGARRPVILGDLTSGG
jgi:anhydro-N-acetylmuramic acid kinase